MEETLGKRINRERIQHANEVDADVVATACPFCLTMMMEGATSQGLAIDVADVAQIVAGSMVEDQRLPLQFPKHDDVAPRLEGWPQPRSEPNANAVHPDDPIDPDALLNELRAGPEDLLPIPMPRHDDGHNHAESNGGGAPAATAVVTAPLETAESSHKQPAATPATAPSTSGLPDTIRITEEGESEV